MSRILITTMMPQTSVMPLSRLILMTPLHGPMNETCLTLMLMLLKNSLLPPLYLPTLNNHPLQTPLDHNLLLLLLLLVHRLLFLHPLLKPLFYSHHLNRRQTLNLLTLHLSSILHLLIVNHNTFWTHKVLSRPMSLSLMLRPNPRLPILHLPILRLPILRPPTLHLSILPPVLPVLEFPVVLLLWFLRL